MKRTIMMVLTLGITTVSLLTLSQQSSRAAGNVYYVCDCQIGADGNCVAGSDANSGSDPAAPWQNYSQARTFFNSSLTPGDEIRFCRGGAFDLGSGSGRWVNANCTAAQPCTVADYTPPWASGDESRPILSRPTDDHAFDLANGGSALAEGGYIFQNLDLRCPGCTSAGWAFFLFNDVNDVLIDNISMDGFAIGVHLAGANACNSGDAQCNGQNDRITIRNVDITNSDHQGILGGANTLLIENSRFENNGDGSVFDHNIYISNGSSITIRNNALYRSSLDTGGNCGGTSLVGHGVLNNLLIEGNWVHEDVGKANQGCWGISITTGYSTAETFNNVTIRGNRVENVGNVAIGISACISCTVENNVVVHQQGFGVTAIAVPDKAPGAGDAVSTGLNVRNNSIAAIGGTAIRLSEGSGHTLVSNSIQATATDAAWNCFDLPLATGNYKVIDYNVCGFSAGEWVNGVGDLTAWQALGWGTNSQTVNPGFTSTSNLMPATASVAMVDAGHPGLSSPIDFNGDTRLLSPDAGAYEWLEAAHVYLPVVLK
ncbi:MAG: right-handed parallel beta-helix repeat-containing protein [Anaerolineae bacterium]|nr:right-handed parallel beta-helix repeat-containing protein [Anaerolineae bacterium]